MVSVYIGGLVAGATFDSYPLLLAVVVTFFITAASMTFNDFFDSKIDKLNHPERPIPMGIITPKEMLVFTIVFFCIGAMISLLINMLCFGIVLFSIVFLFVYEV